MFGELRKFQHERRYPRNVVTGRCYECQEALVGILSDKSETGVGTKQGTEVRI